MPSLELCLETRNSKQTAFLSDWGKRPLRKENSDMTLSEKICVLRKRRGWSQEDLAVQMDVSRQAVAKWEAGQTVPSLEKILQLSSVFEISTDRLLKDELDLPAVQAPDAGLKEETDKKDGADNNRPHPPKPPVGNSSNHAGTNNSESLEAESEAQAWKSLADLVSASAPAGDDPLSYEKTEPAEKTGPTDHTGQKGQNGPKGHKDPIEAFASKIESAASASSHLFGSLHEDKEETPVIDEREAMACMYDKKAASKLIAYGVFLCILSPVCLLVFCGLSMWGLINEMTASALGLCILLLFVACGVTLFIKADTYVKPWEYLNHTVVSLTDDARKSLLEIRDEREKRKQAMIAAGVAFCILSALPIFASLIFRRDWLMVSSVGVTLVFVAIGVWLFIRADEGSATDVLLQEGAYTPKAKESNKVMKVIAPVYWLIVVGLYLLSSFLSGSWEHTWAIFPIAGILFAILGNIISASRHKSAREISRG